MPPRPSILHRLSRRQIALFCIVALCVVASYAERFIPLERQTLAGSPPAPASNDRARYDRRVGTVTQVIDGDTLDVALESRETLRVRLLGVDAPDDPSTDLGAKAAAYLLARVKHDVVTLRLDELSRPTDGRLVAYVYLADGELLNDSIVRDGWAFTHRAEPCDFSGQFEVSETAARAAKRGLWRTIAVDQMPAWRQKWLAGRGLK